ncbi:MAG: hypothetical protein JJE41_13705 [Candidatus Heimdallarchaeota archaeon]|nr:hypothetical protein [Candidatus Heimdallarchaeota archaeon]
MKSNKIRVTITLLLIALFPLSMMTTFGMAVMKPPKNGELLPNASASYVEDFTTLTYLEPTSQAFGWGKGTVTNARNISYATQDLFATPDPITGLDVQGRRVYAASYNQSFVGPETLYIFDIYDPTDIKMTSSRDSWANMYSIAVDGDILYGGLGYGVDPPRISTYNATDPFGLDVGAAYLDSVAADGAITDIEPFGHLVYYTAYNSTTGISLRLIDASDPANPIGITTDWGTDKPMGLDISGQLGYIAASDEGFYILNLTDKWSPVEYGYVDTPGNATDVIVNGRFAYLADGPAGVHVIDIFDPHNPVIVGSYDTPGHAQRLFLQGRTLFVADGLGGVQILDVADPGMPSFVQQIVPADYVYDLDMMGNYLVVGTNEGIHTYKVGSFNGGISNINNHVYPNHFSAFQVLDVRVVGDIAFVVGGEDGFYTVNVHDPNDPFLLDRWNLTGVYFKSLEVYGQFAYCIDDLGMYTFDISNPANIELTRFEIGTDIEDIKLWGPNAYVTYGDPSTSGFASLNYTFAFGDGFVNNFNFGVNITAIDVQGPHVYTVENSGISGTDAFFAHQMIPDPMVADFKDVYDALWGLNTDLFVAGDLAFLSDTNWCVIFNITDPTNLDWLGDISLDSTYITSTGVWAFGPYVLSAATTNGLYFMDTLNYQSTLNLPGSNYADATGAVKVTTSGDYTYVANTTNLIIIRHYESSADTYVAGVHLVQSKEIDSFVDNDIIKKATLNAVTFNPPGTAITYFMTVNGVNWEEVTPGVEHEFVNEGNDLRWRAAIDGPSDRSVHLYELTIDYGTGGLSPMMLYILIGVGGAILLIIIVILTAIRRKKSGPTR